MDFDVFLSHNSKDKPAVRELKALLEANGLRAWLDEDELQPGIPWQQLLEAGIRTSKSVAVLVGKDGLGPWEDEEMQAALVLAVKDKRPCIPVLLPAAAAQPELPMFLGNRTWVDLRAGFGDESLAKLIWGITGKKPARIAKSIQTARQQDQAIIAPTRLHHGADHLFGREDELAGLNQLADDPTKKVLTIVAFGGVGKTSLVIEWIARQAAKNWEGWDRVFDWSFFSQGTREQGGASAEGFVAEALRFFGDDAMAQSAASPWDKGARLAQLVAQRRTLLVLDGVEPLQHPPGPLAGELKDPALATLLKGLARSNSGLCIVTTRERVADLSPFRDTTAPEWQLHHLSITAGVELLKTLGLRGTAAEFGQLVEKVKGHALTLNLLGRYLAKAHGGDIRKSDQVKFEKADAATQGGYAFKTIGVYEKWLSEGGKDGARQLAVLRLLGLFDRPADSGCITALRSKPVIPDLTEPLIGLDEEDWNLTISSLAECGLATVQSDQSEIRNSQLGIDAHPLIREYFAKQLRERNPDAWRSAHRRLYEHLRDNTHEGAQPSLEDLQPLYQAVSHGCHAGLQQQVVQETYIDRILRGDQAFSLTYLGALGSDLAAVACFFDKPWGRISPSLVADYQAWLFNQAAFCLRALGRLIDALEPMRAGLEMRKKAGAWDRAARVANNLSELELTLGEVAAAIAAGQQSANFAERGGESFARMGFRPTFADALHQSGQVLEAEKQFLEAEQVQAESQPKYPLFPSPPNFKYCELLLAGAERHAWKSILEVNYEVPSSEAISTCRIARERSVKTLSWDGIAWQSTILSPALDHLTLGRSALYEACLEKSGLENSRSEIESAVTGLRAAGQVQELPQGLLTRAWLRSITHNQTGPESAQADLDEAWEIAERGPMRLHIADIHLYRARLFHAVKPYPWNKNPDGTERGPKDDLAAARKLIEQCGYWRRKEELEDAEEAAKNW